MAGLNGHDNDNEKDQISRTSVKANNAKFNDSNGMETPTLQSANTRQRARLKELVERLINDAKIGQSPILDLSRKQLATIPTDLLEIKSLKVFASHIFDFVCFIHYLNRSMNK